MPPKKKKKGFSPTNTPFPLSDYEKEYEIQRIEILEKLLPSSSNGKAIDLGCGPGFFSRILSEKGWSVTAVDTDEQNIKNAQNFSTESHLGDAIEVLSKKPAGCYDLVIALEIIEHMPKNIGEKLLEGIARVLRTDGMFIISTPNRFSPEGFGEYYWGEKIRGWGAWKAWDSTHVHIYSSTEMLSLLKAKGFTVRRVTGYYYKGRLPIIHNWGLPLTKSTRFPMNRLGFNLMVECKKK